MARRLAIAVAVMLAFGCRSQPAPGAVQGVGWRRLGSWSGTGSTQTASFESTSGQLRVRWQATRARGADEGTLRLTAHSAISGRPLQVAVDRRGAGQGVAYVDQDPHVFYIEVESTGLDWSFTVDEAVGGTVQGVPAPTKR